MLELGLFEADVLGYRVEEGVGEIECGLAELIRQSGRHGGSEPTLISCFLGVSSMGFCLEGSGVGRLFPSG